jgi:uncharacterized protein
MNPSKTRNCLSRRAFGGTLAAGGTVIAALGQQTPPQTTAAPQPRRREPRPEVRPFDGAITFSRKEVPAKVEPFPMHQVRVTGGMFLDATDWNRGYMNRLAPDRLLYNFRVNAGLSTRNAKPLADMSAGRISSWEHPNDGTRATELRGHFTGHYLSASAQLAANGDREAKARGEYLVDELAKVQQKLGGGYLSAFPMELFDRLDALSGKPPSSSGPALPWAPFYTVHKILAGMIDMHRLAGNRKALEVAQGMADWADRWTASKSEGHMQEILETEYGGMAESLYSLSALTNNDQWAKAGDRFTKLWFFNMLGMRRDELHRGRNGFPMHVNTHIPQVIGAARRYEITDEGRFHDVADYFWHEVVGARAYVTGGTSNGETWQMEPRRLGAELRLATTATAECCCAYNMLKLTRHLFSWTADPRYFDYYERTLLNHRIGTIRPQTGYTQYYLSLKPGTYKTFNSEDNSFWCCTGTGVEEYSKLNDSIYWRDAEGIYVNLFIPSELNWSETGFRLKQETRFPEQQSTTLSVALDHPVQIAIRLRIPSWLRQGPTVRLNGKVLDATASPGSYLTLKRTWNNRDRIELELPMHLRAEAMPDEPTTQAFLYGPLVLAGDLGGEGLRESVIIGSNAPLQTLLSNDIPSLRATGGDPSSWMKPGDGPLTFRTSGQARDLTLVPLNGLFDRRYVVYWQVG